MSERDKKKISERLSKLDKDRSLRLIAHMKQAAAAEEPPSPNAFSSRTDYRQALIDYELKKGASLYSGTANRLRDIGLKVSEKPLVGSLIIEGKVSQLIEGLSDDAIESASFDDQLSLPKVDRNPR